MMNIMHFYEAGKARSGVAYIGVKRIDDLIRLYFSTRHGNAVVDWGDGNVNAFTTPKNNDYTISPDGFISHAYSTTFEGDVKITFAQGLKDVYSFNTNHIATPAQLNIQNWGLFINQFPNLYSINMFASTTNEAQFGTIKGDLADIPASVERFKIFIFGFKNPTTDVWFNFSTIPTNSKLKYIDFYDEQGSTGYRKILGDLSNIPAGCSFIRINRISSNSSITYTAGKVWASSFDTLSIPLALTTTELDNLLIDMNNSITTKIGAGVIYLGGWRSSISDSAVASLQAKGFTVDVKVKHIVLDSSVIFRMDFQNNYDIYSNSLIDITSGNGVGALGNLPTFAISGRKTGEYCAVFNGSQSIKTTTNLPVNSDKVTIAFWMKADSSTAGIIGELSADINSNNAFNAYLNVSNVKNFNVSSRQIGLNQSRIDNNSLHGNVWNRIVIVIDRSLNASNEILIYVNGSLATITKPISTDNNGNFVNNMFFIGQRGGSTVGFVGSLMHYKVHNYPFTPAEVTADYNAFL